MKRLFLLASVLSLLILPVSAESAASSEETSDPVSTEVTKTEEGVTVNVTIEQPAATQEPITENVQTDLVDPHSVSTFSVTQPDVLETVQSDGDVSVMADVIKNVLGEYQRQTYTVQELDSEGNVISTSTMYVEGLAGLDYHWLAGALLFVVFFTGSFKLLGGLIR